MLVLRERLITTVIMRCYGVPERDEDFKKLVSETLFKIALELVIHELKANQLPVNVVIGRHLNHRRLRNRYIAQ